MPETLSQETETAPAADPAGAGLSPDEGWQLAKNGRQFASNPGGGWPVWRRGNESVQEALTRAAADKPDKPPRSKRRRAEQAKASGAKPAVSRDQLTREIQEACAGILTAPAIGCAMFGDEWGANHFQVQGERFAANLARSSEHNPWLRSKLEKLTEGELAIVAVLTSVSLAAGAVGYIMPPLIKYLDLPVPERARFMLGVPLSPIYAGAALEAEPDPGADPGAVPISDALADPEQLEALAAMFSAVNGGGAEPGAIVDDDGTDTDPGVSQPA